MNYRDRFDRRAGERPLCPFCEELIGKARFPEGPVLDEFETGACTYCGALFACDPTSKKRGAALMELLIRLVGGQLDQALKLEAGKDYEQKTVLDYNPRLHRVQPSEGHRGRQLFSKSGFGALVFVRRLKDGIPVSDPTRPEGA
jgi:hypothetical protein